jgi:hypothetical protein
MLASAESSSVRSWSMNWPQYVYTAGTGDGGAGLATGSAIAPPRRRSSAITWGASADGRWLSASPTRFANR